MDFSCLDVAEAFGLGEPEERGQELLYECPCHDDNDPSLSINPHKNAENGGVFICPPCGVSGGPWALAAFLIGCNPSNKKKIIAWLKKVGIFNGRNSRPVSSHPYEDEDRKPLFRVERYRVSKPPWKTFAISRADGKGGWVRGLKDTRVVPYRLPDFLPRKTVFVVEGEGNANELWLWDIAATTNPFGAGKWKQEFNRFFEDTYVGIIPDNDKPGKRHAYDIARHLLPVAEAVKIVSLPDLPEKGDFIDWKNAGGTHDQFREIVNSFPDLTLKDLEELEQKIRKGNGRNCKSRKKKPGQQAEIKTAKGEPDLLKFGLNDSGNTERLIALYGSDLRYCPKFKKWLTWDGRCWAVDELGCATKLAKEAMIQLYRQALSTENDKLEQFAKGSLNATRIKGLLEMARCELPIDVESLDTHHFLLNCLNGTLDLTTGELREHRRQDFITKLVHFDYKPDAECPLFTGFIHEIMGASPDSSESELRRSSGLVDYLHKAFGYSSTGDVSEKAIFCCFGDGNNGKTTLLETIAQVLAEYSSQLVIDTLMTKRFESNNSSADIADLRGARFVTTSEGEEGQRLAEAKVKYLSAGMGKIKTARKYENHIQFQATHKLFMDSNHKPGVRGVDNAIWNRLKAIPFNVTIPKDRIDKEMLEKLLGEAEGILAWIVEGCLRWQKEGLGEPPEVVETKKGWREEMDPLKDFVEDRCVVKEGTQCKSSELRMAYEDWAKQNGETVFSSKWFANRLKVLGCESGKIGGDRGWKGIGLKELKD